MLSSEGMGPLETSLLLHLIQDWLNRGLNTLGEKLQDQFSFLFQKI